MDSLKAKWRAREQEGVLRYSSNQPTLRPSKDGRFVVHLLQERLSKRQLGVQIKSTSQPYDESKFHFRKVKLNEVVALVTSHETEEDTPMRFDFDPFPGVDESSLLGDHLPSFSKDAPGQKGKEGNPTSASPLLLAILMNVNPVLDFHSVLCPHIDKPLPQLYTRETTLLVLRTYLSLARETGGKGRNLRLMFNSIGAHASVNSLHWHILDLPDTYPQRLMANTKSSSDTQADLRAYPIENAPCQGGYPLLKGCVFETVPSWPVDTFVLSLEEKPGTDGSGWEKDAKTLESGMSAMVQVLQENDIPFNIYVSAEPKLRAFVWPRIFDFEAPSDGKCLVAVCELAGHFILYDEAFFRQETLTAEEREGIAQQENGRETGPGPSGLETAAVLFRHPAGVINDLIWKKLFKSA
uniref:GDP-D-glucose phosphorylase 1 n=1 Tax=Chromera velia CCMP2878 TaxID=1169474 RepID=A0A0G4HUE9_9ALVE|eukprot:Cvel_8637.t1-p1 / transcript=Cvel_8637.t1 / gene=Cvel_8637 / organism=Chromera_velia_CCMP2878 / gene_product=GDP-L-galactose phosphorylase 2, putative / transcript_product=GDP-L-galactose phosphorylase 2, putative / location=Cvel_scaffold481:17253-19705(-) / protein_length=409 / sequence_SO=supercontig / SO=protein_coding / is_pseudo=false